VDEHIHDEEDEEQDAASTGWSIQVFEIDEKKEREEEDRKGMGIRSQVKVCEKERCGYSQ
jgi:hypothetical protein